jgi:peptidoglycan-associated lipoprotein
MSLHISPAASGLLLVSLLIGGCASEKALLTQTQPLQQRIDRVEHDLVSAGEAGLRAAEARIEARIEARAEALTRRQLELANKLGEVEIGLAKLNEQIESRDLRVAEALSGLALQDEKQQAGLVGMRKQLDVVAADAQTGLAQGAAILARQERDAAAGVVVAKRVADAERRIDEVGRLAQAAARESSNQADALLRRQATAEDAAELANVATSARLRQAEEKLNTLAGLVQEALALAAKEIFLANGKEAFTVMLTEDRVLYPQNDPYLESGDVGKLADLAARLSKLDQEYHLDIQGHTANSSTDDNNYSLGKARAEVVKRHLHEKQGISINRMSTISYGANKPLAAGNGNNRRIFIRVLVLK